MERTPFSEHDAIARHIAIKAGIIITVPADIIEAIVEDGLPWTDLKDGLKDVIADYLVTLTHIRKELEP